MRNLYQKINNQLYLIEMGRKARNNFFPIYSIFNPLSKLTNGEFNSKPVELTISDTPNSLFPIQSIEIKIDDIVISNDNISPSEEFYYKTIINDIETGTHIITWTFIDEFENKSGEISQKFIIYPQPVINKVNIINLTDNSIDNDINLSIIVEKPSDNSNLEIDYSELQVKLQNDAEENIFTETTIDNTTENLVRINNLNYSTQYSVSARYLHNKIPSEWGYIKNITTKNNPINIIARIQTELTGEYNQQWKRIDIDDSEDIIADLDLTNHPIYSNIVKETIDGNEMVRIPKFYYKRNISSNGKDSRTISDVSYPGFELHPAFIVNNEVKDCIWIGAYQASSSSGVLASIPDQLPLVNQSYNLFNSRAKSINYDYHIWNIHELSAIQLLYLMEYGDTHSIRKLGSGYTMGDSSEIKMVNSNQVKTASYRGIVGLWGNIDQLCDGIRIVNGIIKIDMNNGLGYVNTDLSLVSGYPLVMSNLKETNYKTSHLFIASTVTDNMSISNYPDQQMIVAGINEERIFGIGGYSNDSSGLFYLNSNYGLNGSPRLGTRLAKY